MSTFAVLVAVVMIAMPVALATKNGAIAACAVVIVFAATLALMLP